MYIVTNCIDVLWFKVIIEQSFQIYGLGIVLFIELYTVVDIVVLNKMMNSCWLISFFLYGHFYIYLL